MPYIRFIGLAFAVALASACASTPMPTEKLAVADDAVHRAEKAGAAEFAAAELALARDKLQRARNGAEERDLPAVEVNRLAEQAVADAHFAEAAAQAGKAKAALEEAENNLRALEEEAERSARVE
jgi:Domain of unknown function (DUF4398)